MKFDSINTPRAHAFAPCDWCQHPTRGLFVVDTGTCCPACCPSNIEADEMFAQGAMDAAAAFGILAPETEEEERTWWMFEAEARGALAHALTLGKLGTLHSVAEVEQAIIRTVNELRGTPETRRTVKAQRARSARA